MVKEKNNVTVSFVITATVLASLLLVAMNAATGYVSTNTKSSVNSTLSPNQLTASGPLPGNLSVMEGEQECIASHHSDTTHLPWYPSLAQKYYGSERTGVFECAHFGGSFNEPNRVYAFQSPDSLGAIPSWIDTRKPNELYVSRGGASLALPGPFISKM
jgi:hypothetical protein